MQQEHSHMVIFQNLLLSQDCGMDPSEARRLNVKRLISENFKNKQTLFAAKIAKPDSYVTRMLSDPDKGGSRTIGERMARHIEECLGLAKYALDKPNIATPFQVKEPEPTYTVSAAFQESVFIAESTITFAAGSGQASYEIDQLGAPATYRLEWFVKERINPANCKRFKVRGDSMESTLFDGDTILVNLGEQQIVDGKVYAMRYGDDLKVKRLYRRLDGTIVLQSDNPRYAEEIVPPGDTQESIAVIGRVRDKSGKGGL
jgi:phage repressor protein C with HTH and peptisase S24 domain